MPASGGGAPWWCWPILAASVLSVSSAGVVFATMNAVPPITLASWRLQLTALFLCVGALFQWRQADAPTRSAARSALPLLAVSGGWLALHFALWVASLQLTSLPHSVLIISLSPVLLVLHARWTGGAAAVAPGEAWGVALAAAGAAVLSAGAAASQGKSGGGGADGATTPPPPPSHDVPASIVGDAAAFAGCVAVLGYLLLGRRLRTRGASADAPPPLPLFLYAAPVTLLAALLLTCAGALLESPPSPAEGVFGWMLLPGNGDGDGGGSGGEASGASGGGASGASGGGLSVYGPRVLYLAVFPGIVGHTGFNFLLAHVAPLAVSLALDLECVVAPAMARLAGVTTRPLPGTTWIGGGMMVAAAVIVTVAGARRESAAAAAAMALAAGGEGVAMARLPTHDSDDDEEEQGEEGKAAKGDVPAPVPLFSLTDDGEDGRLEGGGAALAPEWAGLHRHRH